MKTTISQSNKNNQHKLHTIYSKICVLNDNRLLHQKIFEQSHLDGGLTKSTWIQALDYATMLNIVF